MGGDGGGEVEFGHSMAPVVQGFKGGGRGARNLFTIQNLQYSHHTDSLCVAVDTGQWTVVYCNYSVLYVF